MPKNVYKLASGEIVPGCTTICNQLDKPALMNWAWECGKKGIDWKEERDTAGGIGTEVHDMVMKFWTGEAVKLEGEIQTTCFQNFMKWWATHKKIDLILAEEPLVSEKYRFGGQPDFFIKTNNKRVLCDLKTSKGIWENYWYQLAGYDILLREHGYKPQEYEILRLGKDGSWEVQTRKELTKEKRIFRHLLGIYYDRR